MRFVRINESPILGLFPKEVTIICNLGRGLKEKKHFLLTSPTKFADLTTDIKVVNNQLLAQVSFLPNFQIYIFPLKYSTNM